MSIVEYFIGGGGDKGDWITGVTSATNIMEAVSLERSKTSDGILCEYRGHEEESAILNEIKIKWKTGEYKHIRLTGHSWGGQAAMDIAQNLFILKIPVEELITLDPVSLFPFGKVYAAKWVNVYNKPSLIDNTVGKIPIAGNIISGVLTSLTLVTKAGALDNIVANIGGQLGHENGAYNIEIDVAHGHAQAMYHRARKGIVNAPVNPKVNGVR